MSLLIPRATGQKLVLSKAFTWSDTIWNPSMVSGLTAWFDAADSSTIATSGSAVTQWSDKSGLGNHATPIAIANRPTKATNEIVFDGVSNFLRTPAAISSTAFTFFIVCNADAASLDANGRAWATLSNGANANGFFHLIYRSDISNRVRWTTTSDGGVVNFSAITLLSQYQFPSKSIFSGEASATRSLFLDAVSQGSGSTVAPAVTNQRLYLGNYYNEVPSYPLKGSIFETALYAASVSTTDRQKLEGYFAWKWNLTASLPAGHPYKTTPPTP